MAQLRIAAAYGGVDGGGDRAVQGANLIAGLDVAVATPDGPGHWLFLHWISNWTSSEYFSIMTFVKKKGGCNFNGVQMCCRDF